MKPIRTILCPVDFSEPSRQAAGYAAMLARCLGARVLVLYSAPKLARYDIFDVSEESIEKMVKAILEGAGQAMVEFIRDLFEGVETEQLVEVGYPPEAIVATAKERGVDLIVMGTHGRRGVGRLVFGSVAEKVVKSSPVPVMTVRPAGAPTQEE